MTWQPPPRPNWVRAVNDGLVLPIAEVAELPFSRDDLLAEARATLGIADGGMADFGRDDFLEPLDVLLPALEHEAALTVIGRWMTRRFLLRFLEVRLQLVAYVRDDPGVVDEEIAAPLFVTGAPRTGTTILHALLAQDARSRVPEGWELLRPVPPPSPDPVEYAVDARIPLADRELRLPGQVAGELDAIHVYRGRMHKECLSAMSFAFRSEEFTARYHVPSYVAWYERCDMRPAYDAHKLVLQILQRRSRNVQWVLKSPVHLERAAHAVRGVPRRASGDHAPRSAHGARVAHQPGRDPALGAQRSRRLHRARSLPRARLVRGPRRPGHRQHRRLAGSLARAPRALRRLHAGPGRHDRGARRRTRPHARSRDQRGRSATTSRPGPRTSTARTSTRSPTSGSTGTSSVGGSRATSATSPYPRKGEPMTDALDDWQRFLAGSTRSVARSPRRRSRPRTRTTPRASGTSRSRLPAGSSGRWGTRIRGRRCSSARTISCASGADPTPTTSTATRACTRRCGIASRGRMHSCEDFILAIRRNFMHMEGSGTIAELSRARHRHRTGRRVRDPSGR